MSDAARAGSTAASIGGQALAVLGVQQFITAYKAVTERAGRNPSSMTGEMVVRRHRDCTSEGEHERT